MKANVPQEEQETIINYARYGIGEWAEVYSTDSIIIKRYEKFCKTHPDCAKILKKDQYSVTFSVDPRCASLSPRAPRKTTISEERRQELKERMTQIRAKKTS